MLLIEDEYKRIQILKREVGSQFLISNKYKDEREWSTLYYLLNLLKESNGEYPVYANHLDQPEPDFITYDKDENEYKPIEVVEVLTPLRKRGKEYIEYQNNIDCEVKETKMVANPWASFIQNLNNKFLKQYQRNCWLLIYHNMSYGEISLFG